MATSHTPLPAPMTNSTALRTTRFGARARAGYARQQTTMHTTSTARAPTAATSRPENGIASSEPTAMNSRANPSPRSSAPRSSRTAGSREAQVANSPPLAAKTSRVAQADRRTSSSPGVPATVSPTRATLGPGLRSEDGAEDDDKDEQGQHGQHHAASRPRVHGPTLRPGRQRPERQQRPGRHVVVRR